MVRDWTILSLSNQNYGFVYIYIGEKKEILLADEIKIINRNDEILTKCRHRNKYLLENWKQDNTKKKK